MKQSCVLFTATATHGLIWFEFIPWDQLEKLKMSKIIYVMGYGRSGSTFYESLLQAREDLHGFGEIKYLAERGVLNNELCGCGQPATICPFWANVITELGEWDYAEISRVTDKLESSKSFFNNLRLARCGKLDEEIDLYQRFNYRLFEILGRQGGFVDSSKMPARAFFLAYGRAQPYSKIIWFVRDPRGVAWSCMKDIDRPEAQHAKDAKMPRWGYVPSLIKWLINTYVSHYVALQFADRVVVKRYENLMSEFDLGNATMSSKRVEVLHSISGNPGRFTGGLHVFRLDDAWQKHLSVWQKKLGFLLCTPALRRVSQFERTKY
ncbi:sulfotransferase [uncultured Pseudophaeobacter sp.]|jgi:hypothetical protein|uniref:sulfotransferase n=2 Tax=Pseudophaeobacter TaxID=1541822 RepID=UPI0025FF4425|nr:sulfotransferase [uncultured Pseudophaeobacter sp.]